MTALEDFLARMYRENDEMKHEIKALKARIEEVERPVTVTINMADSADFLDVKNENNGVKVRYTHYAIEAMRHDPVLLQWGIAQLMDLIIGKESDNEKR